MNIPLSSPDITHSEIQVLVDVLKSARLSLGPRLQEFEEKLAAYIGAKYAVAVNSGTSGLHLAIKSLGIGHEDAVITTPFSFIASANCMLYEKALPVFVDIDPKTFNIDPEKVRDYLAENCSRDPKTGLPVDKRTGRFIRAILPVHVFGLPCAMKDILEIAGEYNLYVIEDACESIGAEYHGKKVGIIGDIGVFAFYPNKQITTGEGGMILTNNENIALLCKSLRNQGRDNYGGWLAHERLGYNYRMSDINCALGSSQLDRIGEILEKREKVAARYNRQLKDLVAIPGTFRGLKRSWFVYVVCLPDNCSMETRDAVLAELTKKGIGCNNYFPPIHLQPFYRKELHYREGDFSITEKVSRRTIALPFHNNLKKDEIQYVADSLRELLQGSGSKVKGLDLAAAVAPGCI